ncbi:myb/SANT-like DNA-binding domain-containing protein 3 [Photinus pyralis]|uniref:myb/SANT-like DNA-binding domain-containing protein 3 n=1 Tax=Photinus pyralis TaxID=7054 RepID=UPI0012673861|nr:myb/SANT-like DNA-binding domain-containing protein 3 [Photinus pyralis]
MDVTKNKRKRTSNFTADEKDTLFNIVYNYKHVVENKKTDAVTWREKENAWEKIASDYNSMASIPRPMESLRKCYMNKKKQIRQDVSNERIQLLQTGGGPPEMPRDDPHKELLLKIMNKKTIAGLDNPFDMDNIVQSSCDQNENTQSPGNPASETSSYVGEVEMLSPCDIDNIEVITEDDPIAVNLEENQVSIVCNVCQCKSC